MPDVYLNPTIIKAVAVFSFIFGMIWGSFLNVCIYRIPENKSCVFPPSACPKCGRNIRWYENIPVISWLFLRGKCAGCGLSISIIYPLVELLTGFLFMYTFIYFGYSLDTLFIWFFSASMIVVAGVDIKVQIIPFRVVLPGIILGMVHAWVSPERVIFDAVLGAVIGGGILFFIIALFYFVTKKMGMGGGDVVLLAMIGSFTGPMKLPAILFVASVSGIIFYLVMKIVFRKKVIASEITKEDINSQDDVDLTKVIYFGPFLAFAGILFIFIPNEQIVSLLSLNFSG